MSFIIPLEPTEKNMEPLDKMLAEYNSMDTRLAKICLDAFENYPSNFEKTKRIHQQELNIYKNRMEYWLSQYDRFNELMWTGGYVYKFPDFEPKLLRALIKTEQILSDGTSDDYGKYTTMGINTYPEDEEFNRRKVEKSDLNTF